MLHSSDTIILVTHDLDILNKMNKVIFINKQTTTHGTHSYLYNTNLHYKNMLDTLPNIISEAK